MGRKIGLGFAVLLFAIMAVTCLAATPDSTGKSATQPNPTKSKVSGEYYVIETFHRVFKDFYQIDTVAFGEPFLLGEEEDTARIIVFNPHLVIRLINDTTAEAEQASDTLLNPAVRIRVSKNKLLQESWAFYYGGAPHFRATDFFGFKIKEFHVTDPKYIKPPERK